jgi:hypothetical protein
MERWQWRVECDDDGCGERSRWYRWSWVAYLVARWHIVTKHPWGRVKITAVRPSVEDLIWKSLRR